MSVILLLDDEQLVQEVSKSALTRAGYTVLATAQPDEAIAAATSHQGKIALFITNRRLPDGRSGREVAEQILETRPGMPVLHISGYPEEQLRDEGDITPGGFYLTKPFMPAQLVAKVKEVLGHG